VCFGEKDCLSPRLQIENLSIQGFQDSNQAELLQLDIQDLVQESVDASPGISPDRLLDLSIWEENDNLIFGQELVNVVREQLSAISREEQKKYKDYAGPEGDALVFLSIALPSSLNEMLQNVFGIGENYIFLGVGDRKAVETVGNEVRIFSVSVASIQYNQENENFTKEVLLTKDKIQVIRNHLVSRILAEEYFKKTISEVVVSYYGHSIPKSASDLLSPFKIDNETALIELAI